MTDDMSLPTAMRWVDTYSAAGTAKLPCPLCLGQGWLHFSCGTPWRCKCNQSSAAVPYRRIFPAQPQYYWGDQ